MEREVLWKTLMMNGSIVVFWRHSILEKYVENIRAEGFEVYHFNCESWDKNNCLLEIGNTLEFPDFYGKSLRCF
jgi:hypothetical protein